ncbi:MAG: hypothetical protein CVU11_09215 [Bacteroidetes bacterium HGW-Bacteroidetes-6]|jgi:hypothetical protein|nr:MAG: hypothetical protein CVU11_09215 [Bacteroidetes bacterium HGW-Bacteroidetes-6]
MIGIIRFIIIFVSAVLLMASCAKDPSWDVDVRTPLFSTELGMNDLIADSLLQTNADSSLTFVFDYDLFSITTDSFVSLPDSLYYIHYAIPIGITAPPGTLVMQKTESKYYNLDGAFLTEMLIKSGTLSIRAYNYVGDDAYIEYSLDNSLLNGSPVVVSGTIPSYPVTGEYLQTDFDVSGMFLDLRASYMHCNSLKSTLKIYANPLATSPVVINYNDSIDILVEFKDIVIDYTRGYFGRHEIVASGNDNFPYISDLGIDYLDMDNIDMSITLENYLGVDASFTMNLLSGTGNTNVALNSPWIGKTINLTRATEVPPYSGIVIPSTKTLDFSTANVAEFFENLPTLVNYDISGTMNPLGNVSTGNDFVYYGQGLKAHMHAEIPLNIAFSGLLLRDTINYSLTKSDAWVNSSELYLNVSNGFPLAATFKIFLTDASGIVIDSIVPDNEIASGQVDVNGKVIAPSLTQLKLVLDASQTVHLYEGVQAIIEAHLNTGGTSGQQVKFYPNYKLSVLATGLFNLYVE